jgi:hypothetical protein
MIAVIFEVWQMHEGQGPCDDVRGSQPAEPDHLDLSGLQKARCSAPMMSRTSVRASE